MAAVSDKDKDKGSKTTRRRSTSTRTRARTATPKPPTTVKPGFIHELLASLTLKGVETLAPQPVNVGDTKADSLPDAIDVEAEDAAQPVEILARVYAHLGHRIPGVKRIEKKLEGQDASSGILADVSALFIQLYRRNEDTIQAAVQAGVEQHLAKKAATQQARATAQPHSGSQRIPTAEPIPQTERPDSEGI